MTNLILTDYACIPVCKACREAVSCPKASLTATLRADYTSEPLPEWRPNMEPLTMLSCGCGIPWPIVTLIGSGSPRYVYCDTHGVFKAKLTRKQVDAASKKMKQALRETTGQNKFPEDPPF
jgi:hypothetical protein